MKPTVLLLGPLPPPFMGPAIATEIILNSGLRNSYKLIHQNTGTHRSISTLGSWRFRGFITNILFYFDLVHKIVTKKPDLVLIPISQTTGGFIKDSIFILISWFFGRKPLLQLRGSNFKNWLNGSTKLTRSYVQFVLKRSRGMIVLGNKLVDLFTNYFPSNRIFVVPNGADFDFEVKNKSDQHIRLLYLSNMQPSKGIEDVLHSMEILKISISNFRLDVVGSWWDDQTKLQFLKLVEENKLPVFFHPPMIGKEKADCFSNSDIFVFTPREPEGHPWVIVEAMAAGLPIITTDQGAISESVIDGYNGFIVNTRNPEAIADRIVFLAKNMELRKRMGLESRQLYEKYFTEKCMISKLESCFNTILNEKK